MSKRSIVSLRCCFLDNFADKAVTTPVQGLDQSLFASTVTDRFASRFEPAAQRRLGDDTVAPDLLEQLVLGDYFVAVLNQIAEDVEDLWLQLTRHAVLPQLEEPSVEFEIANE